MAQSNVTHLEIRQKLLVASKKRNRATVVTDARMIMLADDMGLRFIADGLGVEIAL